MKTRNGTRGTLLAVLFLAAVVIAFTGCTTAGTTRILSYYGDYRSVTGTQRYAPHAGVDFDAPHDAPVLAAADGTVIAITTKTCGNGIVLQHLVGEQIYFYTVYCHLNEVGVKELQDVRRGEVIGKAGATGRKSGGVPHVHFELCSRLCYGHPDGYMGSTLDPLPFIVGCFDPTDKEGYAALAKKDKEPRLILTYPVQCAPKKKKPS